jgi:oligoribonuclease NrnB/cAMP/cGMP phosphodiesterase (DHH superfamily)
MGFQTGVQEREKTLNKGRTAIVISHGPYCLDGIASAACVGRFYGEVNVTPIFTHPSGVDRVIKEATQNSNQPQDLWIADITWKTPETDNYLKQLVKDGWRIFWADHHAIAINKRERDVKEIGLTGWVASDQYSAARLLFDYMVSHEDKIGKANQELLEFRKVVLLADDNDRWIHNLSGSRELALTVAALSGIDAYHELVHIDPNVNYSSKMRDAYRKASEELSESVSLANKTKVDRKVDGFGINIVAALCNGFTSEVADSLRKGFKNAIVVLFNLKDQRFSLRRSPECNVNLDRLAQQLGGGGHPAAAGFDLVEESGHFQRYLISRIEEALKRL